jgi:biopolymer transport protein ExbB/TolQ
MDLSSAFVDFAQLGANWVLWLLIALSVVSVGVMIDRFLWFKDRDTNTETFTRELRGAFERDEIERLETKYKDHPAIPIQVGLRGLAERGRGPEAVAEAMHGERARWRRGADRNLMVLGTLGNNVPFIGLFGTVLGIMNAFGLLKDGGSIDTVGPAIAEALISTAFGLLIAIPALMFYNYFTNRVETMVVDMNDVSSEFIDFVLREGRA